MHEDEANQDVEFWLKQIRTRGLDTVSSVLVSKLGTPAAENIQLAMVEFHKENNVDGRVSTTSSSTKVVETADISIRVSRKALIIAWVAVGISIVALVLSVVNFFR